MPKGKEPPPTVAAAPVVWKTYLADVDQRGGVLRDHQLFVGGDDPDGDLGVIGGNDGFLAPVVVQIIVDIRPGFIAGDPDVLRQGELGNAVDAVLARRRSLTLAIRN